MASAHDQGGRALSAAELAMIDDAIGYARAALDAKRAAIRVTLKKLYALREVKASGRMSAIDAADLGDHVKFWKAIVATFPPADVLSDGEV